MAESLHIDESAESFNWVLLCEFNFIGNTFCIRVLCISVVLLLNDMFGNFVFSSSA